MREDPAGGAYWSRAGGSSGVGPGANGAAVYQEIEARSGREVSLPAVHVTLRRLEAKGLVSSLRTSASDAVSRRVFAVTAPGGRALAHTRAVRERLWSGVRIQGET